MASSFKIFMKVFLITAVLSFIAVGIVLSCAAFGFIDSGSDLNIDNLKLNFTTHVYYTDPNNGQAVEYERLQSEEHRIWVNFDQLPKSLIDAVISIEDERFYQHKGVDIKSTFKATVDYLLRRPGGRGASTITQQLVKNLTGDDDVKVSRKVKEMVRALSLERQISKEQVIELYLNTIYLSQGCYGVGSASLTYFGKPVSELNIAESAILAGITQTPSLYDPLLNFENSKQKQSLVLRKMYELGKISKEEYDEALAYELKLSEKRTGLSEQSYFTDQVIEDVLRDLKEQLGYSQAVATKMLYTGGLQIYCTMDPEVQNAMDKVFEDSANFPKAKGEIVPESAMVVIDVTSGAVKGIVGGRGEKKDQRVLNRASQSLRQPGSTIKPIAVYAPAVEHNLISPSSIYTDKRIKYGSWAPANYYSGFKGPMTIRQAVEQSVNTIAVQVLEKVGINTSFSFLKNNLGISSLVDSDVRNGKTFSDKNLPALALGGLTDGISVLELTAAYSAFANRGIYTKPYTYTKVVDISGKTILENEKKTNIAMKEQTASIMNSMLKGVVTSGTGTPANFRRDMAICGKTGTTDSDVDRWFVGYTPYYAATVWFGYDQPKSMRSLYTANPTIPVWRKVMTEIHKNKKSANFDTPKGLKNVTYCTDSQEIATDLCINAGKAKTDYFNDTTAPAKQCTFHYEVKIDADTLYKAHSGCSNVVSVTATTDEPLPEYNGQQIKDEVCPVHKITPSASPGTVNPTASSLPSPSAPVGLPVPIQSFSPSSGDKISTDHNH